MKDALDNSVINSNDEKKINKLSSKKYSKFSMLSRTHGQNASPTTMGKEFAIFYHRIKKVANEIETHK
jgi:adenylosuccinate lyase